MSEYRIDDLARAAGMTSRNVRAYQGLGLLPSPRREGRIAWYSEVHLARLRLLGSLLDRGYTTSQISELIGAWEQGRDLSDVLGIEEALVSPWSDELPTYLSLEQARLVFPRKVDFTRAVELGLLKLEKSRCLVRRPQLLSAIQELQGFGFSPNVALDLHEAIVPLLDSTAELLVAAATEQLTDSIGSSWVPTDQEVAALGPTLQRLRHLATTNVQLTLAQSMERAIQRQLGEFFATMGKSQPGELLTPTLPLDE